MKIKKFNTFIIESANAEAYQVVNEGILDFMSKDSVTDVDTDELKKVQTDVLSKYDLPKGDVDNIKAKISDAIAKKMGTDITSKIKK
ncbi:MAG: hypothetical protein SLAVMIC_00916 [uncultured marine phage]|uniref:Uncharacterized protein n=1 Tax=uncultured marine phage TaxID=707152 RepID=A0A8D9CCY1_9VIRU|nr:MAG: hypothetical protein SLAVMIC_00916 [uncultured marine phage]